MTSILRFDARGTIGCLYTEAIDLRSLGKLEVTRATDIAFDDVTQQWETRSVDTGEVLFSDPSRAVCLEWERDNLLPPG